MEKVHGIHPFVDSNSNTTIAILASLTTWARDSHHVVGPKVWMFSVFKDTTLFRSSIIKVCIDNATSAKRSMGTANYDIAISSQIDPYVQ